MSSFLLPQDTTSDSEIACFSVEDHYVLYPQVIFYETTEIAAVCVCINK